jgi:hypothetical protein
MTRLYKALLLLLVCCILMPALPARADSGIAGRWQGSYGPGTLTLMLGTNGMYISVYEDASTFYKEAGSYLEGNGTLALRSTNGTAVTYRLQYTASSMTLQDMNTGGWIVMAWQPWGVPEGIIGEWQGLSDGENFYLTFFKDSTYDVLDDYISLLEDGIFLTHGNKLLMLSTDESFYEFSYQLGVNQLFLTGEDGSIQTLDLSPEYTPDTPSPATEVPVVTAEPVAIETPAVTAEPIATEAPLVTVIPPVAQPGLAGTWNGKDTSGDMSLTLSETGEISLSYAGDAVPARKGTYTADSVSITAVYDDGTTRGFRYMLMGDTLLLSDEHLSNPVTLTRAAVEPLGPDPLLVGIWGAYAGDTYTEWTYAADGNIYLYVPSESISRTAGTYTAADGHYTVTWSKDGTVTQGSYTVSGNTLLFVGTEATSSYTRKQAPLIRLPQAADTATAATDTLILGSWGGTEGGAYTEWTFFGNGQFTRFVPSDEEQSYSGTYMAVSGSLAAMTQAVSLHGQYTVSGDTLTVAFEGRDPVELLRKPGQLVRGPAIP